MAGQSDKAKGAILKVLNAANGPMGASRIAEALLAMGLDLKPRTIRLYLLQLDADGFTRLISRRTGRVITDKGRQELARANVMDKVGIVSTRVDTLGYRMTFRVRAGKGKVIANVCLIGRDDLWRALAEMEAVYARRLAMGTKIIVVRSGGILGGVEVPSDSIGVGTVCSVSLNGILLHEGIPVTSRFGGLLEMRGGNPIRFVEAIEYRGSTLDPLEVFIKAGMTRVRDAVRTGSGIICASFREVPSVAVEDIRRLERVMKGLGLGAVLAIGKPNQPLFGVPVSEGYSGLVIIGGLNPVAAAHEAGVPISIRSLGGLQEFESLQDFESCFKELKARRRETHADNVALYG